MALVDDFLDLVDNPARRSITPGDAASDALLALLVHMAFSDGSVHEDEFGFLAKVLPNRDPDTLMAWVRSVASQPIDYEAITTALPSTDDRWKGLRFAAKMAWRDGAVQEAERDLLVRLARELDLPEGAVERVVHEMRGTADGAVQADVLLRTLQDMSWGTVQLAAGELQSDLVAVVPEGLEPVARLGLDNVEVGALYQEGLAARFMEGPTFLTWADIVTYTRVPVLGAAMQLHTVDGRTLTLVDSRLRGLGILFDRLFGDPDRPTSAPPKVEVVRAD